MEDVEKYKTLESTLQLINRHFISLQRDDVIENNSILHRILDHIIQKMRAKDQLFDRLFKYLYYGGSFYDGLKVSQPNEYDVDLLLMLPVDVEIIPSDIPGYVKAKLLSSSGYEKLCSRGTAFLDTSKVLSWIEGILQRAFNDIATRNQYSLISILGHDLQGWISKQGPAFTFHITGNIGDSEVEIDIDLVTCFYFSTSSWPQNFKTNPFPNKGFFIVPKKPRQRQDATEYWRLSFQEQERILINGKEKLKPALRLLKKMRLSQNHAVDSYYLKTIVLWEIEREPFTFWYDKSLSYIFMRFLIIYKDKLLDKSIYYYWHDELNLIDYFHGDTCQNIGRRIERIIKDIDRNLHSPEVVAKYILTRSEYNKVFGCQLPYETAVIGGIEDLSIRETARDSSSCIIL